MLPDFTFPDGNGGLELVDQESAGAERLRAVRAEYLNEDAGCADRHFSDGMMQNDVDGVKLSGGAGCYFAHFFECQIFVGVVFQGDEAAEFGIVFSARAAEEYDLATPRFKRRRRKVIRRHLEQANIDRAVILHGNAGSVGSFIQFRRVKRRAAYGVCAS